MLPSVCCVLEFNEQKNCSASWYPGIAGAADGKSQALLFFSSFMQFLLKAREGYYVLDNAYHSTFIPTRSAYAVAIVDGIADF